jgi:hypothetical protein
MSFGSLRFGLTMRLAIAVFMAMAGPEALLAQSAPILIPQTITTIGGGVTAVCGATGTDKIGDGCLATQASFGATSVIASAGDTRALGVDGQGNIIIADSGASMIRKINPRTGLVTAVAGSLSSAAACTVSGTGTPVDKYGDGCVASDGVANLSGGYTGNFNKPRGVYVAPNGDIYIAGYGDYLIHKVSAATGVMSIVAGYITCTSTKYTSCAGAEGYTGDGGTATNYEVVNGVPQLSPTGGAELYQPRGVATDSYGNVYIVDTGDNAIRVVYEAGPTLASLIATEVPGTVAQAGHIYTIAGNPSKTAGAGSGFSGDGGLASAALLTTTEDALVDGNGNVIIADGGNDRIRVIYVGGATMARLITLENPSVTTPVVGDIYTIMGGGAGTTYTAGTSVPANSLLLGDLRKIAIDSRGDLFAIDNGENVVWFEDVSTGYIRAIAGIYGSAYSAYPSSPFSGICAGHTDNVGDGCPATQAVFASAGNGMGIAIDGQDNLYLTDPADARIRKIAINTLFATATSTTPATQTIDVHLGAGETTTPAVTFPSGNADFSQSASTCTANADATVDCMIGVTFDPGHAGMDTSAMLVSGTSTGESVGLRGVGTAATLSIDPGSTSALATTLSNTAQQAAVDGGGNIYVADTGSNRVLLFPANGSASSVIAGGNGNGYSGDNGPATAAKLNGPKGVAVDAAGNVYIADTGNNAVRMVDRVFQHIATIAGGAASVCGLPNDSNGDGCPAAQTILSAPAGLATDLNGNLYVSDTGHNQVRIVTVNGYMYLYAGGTVCVGATDTYGNGCGATQAALSSPAGLTVDGSSNLYIADAGDNLVRKINYVTGAISAVAGNGQAGFAGDGGTATLAQLSSPLGVAVDAAGDIFIADAGNDGLRTVNAATGNISTIAGVLGSAGTGTVPGSATNVLLKGPRGVAVTSQGSLGLVDSSNSRLLQIQRSNISYSFGTVNVGSKSDTQAFTVTSTGSIAASLSSPSAFTGSGNTTDLTLVPSSTQPCSSGNLAVGSNCSMMGQFSPGSATYESAIYLINSSNAVNTISPAILLSGTGKFLISTSIVAAQTVPATGNPQYGQTVTVVATVTPASTTSAMTGTITFKVNGVAGVPVPITYAAGVGTASVILPSQAVGTPTVTAVYSGDFNYAASNDTSAPLTITVTKANATTTLTSSPATLLQFSAETITAAVASTTTGIPTGSVTFFNGTTQLGPASSLNSSGVATLTDSTLGVGSYNVTAVYSGDGNFATSTSAATSFTVGADPQDFELSLSTSAVAIASGSTVQTFLYVTPTNTVSGTLTFSCSGLPQYSTCTFGPPSTLAITPVTNLQTYWQQPIQVTVTLWSDVAPLSAAVLAHRPGVLRAGWPVMLIGFGGLAGFRKRLRHSKAALFLVFVCLLAGASMAFSGCSSNPSGTRYTTPAGTSSVTITVNGPNSTTHAIVAQYTITGPGF